MWQSFHHKTGLFENCDVGAPQINGRVQRSASICIILISCIVLAWARDPLVQFDDSLKNPNQTSSHRHVSCDFTILGAVMMR